MQKDGNGGETLTLSYRCCNISMSDNYQKLWGKLRRISKKTKIDPRSKMLSGVEQYHVASDLREEITNLFKNINGLHIVELSWVYSWGITQHVDSYNGYGILIPLVGEEYTFGYYDESERMQEKDFMGIEHNEGFRDMVVFQTSYLHSLAPSKRPKNPFTAIVIDVSF